MASRDPNQFVPVITRFRLAMLVSVFLAMSLTAVAYGEHAAGLCAAGLTLTFWAAVLKFSWKPQPTPPPTPPVPRPVFVGPDPLPPVSRRVERISQVATDPKRTPGERAAAREALRRIAEGS
jgi:hypothetical protein